MGGRHHTHGLWVVFLVKPSHLALKSMEVRTARELQVPEDVTLKVTIDLLLLLPLPPFILFPNHGMYCFALPHTVIMICYLSISLKQCGQPIMNRNFYNGGGAKNEPFLFLSSLSHVVTIVTERRQTASDCFPLF